MKNRVFRKAVILRAAKDLSASPTAEGFLTALGMTGYLYRFSTRIGSRLAQVTGMKSSYSVASSVPSPSASGVAALNSKTGQTSTASKEGLV